MVRERRRACAIGERRLGRGRGRLLDYGQLRRQGVGPPPHCVELALEPDLLLRRRCKQHHGGDAAVETLERTGIARRPQFLRPMSEPAAGAVVASAPLRELHAQLRAVEVGLGLQLRDAMCEGAAAPMHTPALLVVLAKPRLVQRVAEVLPAAERVGGRRCVARTRPLEPRVIRQVPKVLAPPRRPSGGVSEPGSHPGGHGCSKARAVAPATRGGRQEPRRFQMA
mmetsp:Transcript_127189/g.356198  ORF Transcript_127189/g.356198 Transcript_127189/m.356198 type:complete len:225 (-) Transcript_127189:7-681(-)